MLGASESLVAGISRWPRSAQATTACPSYAESDRGWRRPCKAASGSGPQRERQALVRWCSVAASARRRGADAGDGRPGTRPFSERRSTCAPLSYRSRSIPRSYFRSARRLRARLCAVCSSPALRSRVSTGAAWAPAGPAGWAAAAPAGRATPKETDLVVVASDRSEYMNHMLTKKKSDSDGACLRRPAREDSPRGDPASSHPYTRACPSLHHTIQPPGAARYPRAH